MGKEGLHLRGHEIVEVGAEYGCGCQHPGTDPRGAVTQPRDPGESRDEEVLHANAVSQKGEEHVALRVVPEDDVFPDTRLVS